MRELEAAMEAIERARDDVVKAEVRTNLDSIGASLEEMLDTAAGNPSDAEPALADTQFEGAAPYADHLFELEKNLREQAENAGPDEVREELEFARERIEAYRTRDRDGE